MINVFDLAVLIYNVRRAAAKSYYAGWLDADIPYSRLRKYLDRKVWIEDDLLESCLAGCNYIDEINDWNHPDHPAMTFDDFVKGLLRENETFNRSYNWIDEKKKRKR